MERTGKTLREPILRPVYAEAPVARAFVKKTFPFKNGTFDAQGPESLRYEQSYGSRSDDQDVEVGLHVRLRHEKKNSSSLCETRMMTTDGGKAA